MPKSKKPRSEMTPAEIAKLDKASAERANRRAAKKLADAANMSDADRWKQAHAQWEKNLARLSETERKKVLDHVSEHEYIVGAMISDSNRIRNRVEYGTVNKEGETPFCPEQLLFEVEDFARRFPPTDGVSAYDRFDFEDADCLSGLPSMPLYLREYGYKVDSIGHTAYFDFLHTFCAWYKQNRNSLVLATTTEYGPEFAKTWEEIDALMEQNKRLAWLVGYKPPDPIPEPAPVPKAPPRFEPLPLSEPLQPRFGGWFESTAKNWPRAE
jgi:hypothetical protein